MTLVAGNYEPSYWYGSRPLVNLRYFALMTVVSATGRAQAGQKIY